MTPVSKYGSCNAQNQPDAERQPFPHRTLEKPSISLSRDDTIHNTKGLNPTPPSLIPIQSIASGRTTTTGTHRQKDARIKPNAHTTTKHRTFIKHVTETAREPPDPSEYQDGEYDRHVRRWQFGHLVLYFGAGHHGEQRHCHRRCCRGDSFGQCGCTVCCCDCCCRRRC